MKHFFHENGIPWKYYDIVILQRIWSFNPLVNLAIPRAQCTPALSPAIFRSIFALIHIFEHLSLQIQGDPKKMSLSVFELKSVLDVGFDFSACVLESDSRARFISPL